MGPYAAADASPSGNRTPLWKLSHAAQEWRHRQALHEHRKRHNREGNGYDVVAPGYFSGKAEG
jgi:hypothetical protein